MLRVIHIVPSIAEEASGPSYSVVRLSSALSELKIASNVLTVGERTSLEHSQILQFRPILALKGLKVSFGILVYIVKNRNEIDVIHNNGLWLFSCIFPNFIAKIFRIKLIHSPRGTLAKEALKISKLKKELVWRLIQKRALSKVDLFHATSVKEFNEILTFFPNKKIITIPIGIDIPDLARNKSKRNEVVFIGRIHPIKNLEMLIESWISLKEVTKDYTLRIIGPGKPEYKRSIISAANLANNIYVEEALYGEVKFDILSSSKWSILFSKSENFGVSVLESLSVGTPVITSEGTPWEILNSSEAGIWIPLNKKALTEKLEWIINLDDTEYEKFSFNALDLVRKDFSWKSVATEISKFY